MRVISGVARGTRLKSPKGKQTRPTEDRVKENIFNILQGPFTDKKALDLFSGSGSIGIEFLSRGASLAWFNDRSPKNRRLIVDNLTVSKLQDRARVYCLDYRKLLSLACREEIKFDYIYLDPPYAELEYYHNSVELVTQYNLLKKNGKIIVEAPRECKFHFPKTLVESKSKKYGSTGIWLYEISKE